MNETQTMKSAVVKTLAVVGFLVTMGGLLYFAVMGVGLVPKGFTSLASIAKNINLYRPAEELTIATERAVVNSSDQFQISWTDFKASGEYQFSYECVSGVRLEVRSADDLFVPMNCSEILTLPATVHGLFLTALSDDNRFTDIPLTVTFTNTDTKQTLAHTTKITVVNAMIPVRETLASTDTPADASEEPAVKPAETAPAQTEPQNIVVAEKPETVITDAQKPVVQKAYTDLGVTILGSGVLKEGVFGYTKTFGHNLNNAIRFDVKNVGTKTSDTWSFTTVLPSGELYTSPVQAPLAPQAHVVFTLGFYLDVPQGDVVTFTNTLSTNGNDAKTSNNVASLSVVVE